MAYGELAKPKVTAQDVLDFVRIHPSEVATCLRGEHRTNQQSFMNSIVCIIQSYASHDTDLRNEDSVKWAKEVSKTSRIFPFL